MVQCLNMRRWVLCGFFFFSRNSTKNRRLPTWINKTVFGLPEKEYRNMNMNSYADHCWEVHEKIETDIRKWPFKYPEQAQIWFDFFYSICQMLSPNIISTFTQYSLTFQELQLKTPDYLDNSMRSQLHITRSINSSHTLAQDQSCLKYVSNKERPLTCFSDISWSKQQQ